MANISNQNNLGDKGLISNESLRICSLTCWRGHKGKKVRSWLFCLYSLQVDQSAYSQPVVRTLDCLINENPESALGMNAGGSVK